MEHDLHSNLVAAIDVLKERLGLYDRQLGALLPKHDSAVVNIRAGKATLLTVAAVEGLLRRHGIHSDFRGDLIAQVDAYRARHGLTDRKLGLLLSNNTHAIYRIRNGVGSLRQARAVEDFMRRHGDILPT